MITINGIEISPERFPDGTYCLLNLPLDKFTTDDAFHFVWKYEHNEELLLLWHLVLHFKDFADKDAEFYLHIQYMPNARMDRIKHTCEVFTLKSTAKMINLMGFDRVYVNDPHSNVTPALLDRCITKSPVNAIKAVIDRFTTDGYDVVLFFPDAGAMKRYMDDFKGYRFLYGEKVRDWETGKITSLELKGNFTWTDKECIILMIDDICSYGGTFYYSAKALKEEFPTTKVFSYATHTENIFPRLDQAMEEGLIEEHFTTDSFLGSTKETHPKITVLC